MTNHIWDDNRDENGISDITAPFDCLVGVFLDDTQPDQTPVLASLDFGTQQSRDYLTLAPLLKQVFFIGDGLTSGGEEQHVAQQRWPVRRAGQPCNPTTATRTTWGVLKARYR
jgi:hypothetical protein